MVFFNYALQQLAAKIVYYGPGLSGKTTNLQYIYRRTHPRSRGELVSLETDVDRTLFFDLLPLEVGKIKNFNVRFQLYTVPGQVHYNETRKLVLKGVDGIVFVADSQEALLDANIESLENLKENLAFYNVRIEDIPLVFQYNKRDLPTALPVEVLEKHLNPWGRPYFEAIAIKGIGVFETLKGISRLTLAEIKRKLEEEESRLYVDMAPPEESTLVVKEQTHQQEAPSVKEELQEVEKGTAEEPKRPEKEPQQEIEVVFDEEEAGEEQSVELRRIPIDMKKAEQEIDELVKSILFESKKKKKPGRVERLDLDRIFQEVLQKEKIIKKTIELEVPAEALKASDSIILHIRPSGLKDFFEYTVNLKGAGEKHRVIRLKIDLRITGKE